MTAHTPARAIACALLLLLWGCKRAEPPAPAPPVEEELEAAAPEVPEDFVAAEDAPVFRDDLEGIQKRGVLRILIATHDEAQLPRAGLPTSQERELARAFAQRLGLRPQFVVAGGWDLLLPALSAGKADLIASNLTVTKSRSAQVAFTRPVAVVREVLVGRKGQKGLPRKLKELAGRKIHVRPSSSFAESLEALKRQVPSLQVVAAPESLDSEQLVYEVGRGERPLTVVDSHLLQGIRAYNDEVEELFAIAEGRQIAWATRQDAHALRAVLDAFLTEKSLTGHTEERFTGDLEGIRKRGVLRVLTRNNPVTYYLHQGQPHGFDYQLVALAAKQLKVRLEMVVPPSRDLLIPWLREGKGDVIAASFTVTPERGEQVAFSAPYLFIDEVLVQKKGGGLRSLAELKGRRIHARPSSSYWRTLEALQADHGPFELVAEPEELETEELIAAVGEGEIPLTVADSHLLSLELKYRDDVEMGPRLLGKNVPADAQGTHQIAFAVRRESPELKAFLDKFVKKTYRGLEYNVARKRYFEDARQIRRGKEERAGNTGAISPYDELFQRYAARYGLDWRLLAAQAWQESRYDPKARSWVGAQGLFQVMPRTGKELGFDDLEDPEQGIHAGARYMNKLIKQFEPQLPYRQRVRFALASYNAGFGHVQDARRLAAELKLDPNRWFENVERAMLLLQKPRYYRRARHGYCRGAEPVKYVSEIQNRYDNYVKILATAPEP